MAKKILLQTTIPTTEDDWSIARFSELTRLLREATGPDGAPLYEVVARDRTAPGGPDPVLSTLDTSDFDQLWLFAVDVGDGLDKQDCAAIGRFRARGGGIMATRDHMDLGSSLCTLGGVGKAHYFHSKNLDPDEARRCRDDPYATDIDWPNYHSGANGDYQAIEITGPPHPVFADSAAPNGTIRFLPSHPHEGAVGAPEDEQARVIARGRSRVSGQSFNIAVAFEAQDGAGRAIAQSTFHHFCDYNWNPANGCPSFVEEAPGDAIVRDAEALADTHRYVLNLAAWLS